MLKNHKNKEGCLYRLKRDQAVFMAGVHSRIPSVCKEPAGSKAKAALKKAAAKTQKRIEGMLIERSTVEETNCPTV